MVARTAAGYPLHWGNRENPCQGRHREFGKFAKTRKTQGIWFAQVVNSLILKVKDISFFAAKQSKKIQIIFD